MEPGRRNSLGTVKFMFPNQNSVYLHDTPAKRLFSKTMRQFSHGCVRVERPVELAAYLLGKDTLWVKEAIHKALRKREEHVVRLPEPVPVHLQYFTVWVNDEGSVQFRKDIYHWDNLVSMALNAETTLQRKTGVEQFASEGTDGRRVAAVQ
jgi:murein L,D-transpeptidase YcbB/YkuD